MRPKYKPNPTALVWSEVAHICYAELSEEGRKEIDIIATVMVDELKKRYNGKSSLHLSPEAAREVVVAMIGNGYL